ncbi:hypothetical protein FRC01_005542, partial [Tulasnella sp. 417]
MDKIDFRAEVISVAELDDARAGFVPVLYKPPASTTPVPSSLKYLRPLASKSSKEESEIIRQRNITRFKDRVNTVGKLDPSRVLKCLAYRFGDKPFALMAHVNANPLSRIVSSGFLNPVEKLEVLWRAGKAIEHLHTRVPPVVHGGIHPKAFMVTEGRDVLLADFGYAFVWSSLERDPSLNQDPGTTLKIGYSAPETVASSPEITSEMERPADIFAFASTILAVMSNAHPYAGLNPWSPKGIRVLVEGIPPKPTSHPELPEMDPIWLLLRRMWAKNPDERPGIEEIVAELGQITVARGGALEPAVNDESPTLENAPDVPNLLPQLLTGTLTRETDFTPIQGRFADVWKGYWCQDGEVRVVAIKYLRSTRQNLHKEAQTWGRLNHPNIIKLSAYVEKPDPALVAPWCSNGTLLEYSAHNLPPQTHILELLIQVASAVQYLHNQQPPIVHGDIKPSNVMIGDEGQALLSDFGSTVTEDPSAEDHEVSDQIGTNGYRAPEVTSPAQQTTSADIYSFACLILHVLSGSPPTVPFKLAQQGVIPQPSEHLGLPASDPLWGLLVRCWSLDPLARPKIDSVVDELEAERVLRGTTEIDIDLSVDPKHSLTKPCPVSVGLANELPRASLTKKERIAIGYFADVYKGVLKGVGGIEMPVAIKVLREVGMGSSRTAQERNERLNKRLKRENAAWGRLRHPNILPVLGVCPGIMAWLVTPWMKNGNLHDFVKAHTELSFADKLKLVILAAKGLLYLHSLDPPICHADIKPANVLVSDDGTNSLLADFGLAASLTSLRSPHATSGNPEGTK